MRLNDHSCPRKGFLKYSITSCQNFVDLHQRITAGNLEIGRKPLRALSSAFDLTSSNHKFHDARSESFDTSFNVTMEAVGRHEGLVISNSEPNCRYDCCDQGVHASRSITCYESSPEALNLRIDPYRTRHRWVCH